MFSESNLDTISNDVDLEIVYPGFFLLSYGIFVFDLKYDSQDMVSGSGYLKGFSWRVKTSVGVHRLEIISRGLISKREKESSFLVEFPEPGMYKMTLDYDKWWLAGWRAPIVERV